jgi:hypothetical protein
VSFLVVSGGYIEDVERTTKWIRTFFTLDQRQRECAASGNRNGIYRGAGIVCKRNQEAIDLFIPVLLNSERKWWKENGGLPIYHDSKQWYFAPAEWNEAQTSRVLLNFTAILVQVKNRRRISVSHVHKCHDKIEKRADIIFQTRNKRCVSFLTAWKPQFGAFCERSG